jgi:hypothetical protein
MLTLLIGSWFTSVADVSFGTEVELLVTCVTPFFFYLADLEKSQPSFCLLYFLFLKFPICVN